MSVQEAENYFTSDEDRKCATTEYAKVQGAYISGDYKKGGKFTCSWWLRSPGEYQDYATLVLLDGELYCDGDSVGCDHAGVRPAMWIDLEY